MLERALAWPKGCFGVRAPPTGPNGPNLPARMRGRIASTWLRGASKQTSQHKDQYDWFKFNQTVACSSTIIRVYVGDKTLYSIMSLNKILTKSAVKEICIFVYSRLEIKSRLISLKKNPNSNQRKCFCLTQQPSLERIKITILCIHILMDWFSWYCVEETCIF